MKVRELIERLEQEDPDTEVVVRNAGLSVFGTYRQIEEDNIGLVESVVWIDPSGVRDQFMGPEYRQRIRDEVTRDVLILG